MDCNEIWHRGGPQGRKGSGFFWSSTPNPCGYRVQKGGVGWIRSHRGAFWQKLYKQKFQCAPNLVGAGHHFGPQILILKDLDPISFCSNGHSLSRGVNKIKVVVYVPNSYLVRLNTLYPDPQGPGALKGGQVGFWSLSCAFWQNLYYTNIAGHPQLSGNG